MREKKENYFFVPAAADARVLEGSLVAACDVGDYLHHSRERERGESTKEREVGDREAADVKREERGVC